MAIAAIQGKDTNEGLAVPYLVRLSDELESWLAKQSKAGLVEVIGQLIGETFIREETIDRVLWRAHLNQLGRAAMSADAAYQQAVADSDGWDHRDAAWRRLERAWAARDAAWQLPRDWWRHRAAKRGA